MKPIRIVTAIACVVVLSLHGSAQERTDRPFVVHEWGTFTSMQGADGVLLDGLHHEEESLPHFVYSRTQVRECPLRQYGYKGLEVPVSHVSQKMETPVIYFHSDIRRKVRVRVDFVGGLITQWYPVSNLIGPPEAALTSGPLDLKTIERSFLEWDIELVPAASSASLPFPPVSDTDPWAFARRVDAAAVQTLPRQGKDRRGPVEAERYLFYRGLGTFKLPVVAASADAVRNDAADPVSAAFILEVADGRARWRATGALAPRSRTEFELDQAAWQDVGVAAEAIGKAVQTALVAERLHVDESEAMIRTWSRSWFTTPGRRLIYFLPRRLVDALLPLEITPRPDEIIRVLVGRLELVTPEREKIVEKALLDRLSADATVRAAAMTRLAIFDRFLEPHVRCVLARTRDAAVRRSGEEVLAELK